MNIDKDTALRDAIRIARTYDNLHVCLTTARANQEDRARRFHFVRIIAVTVVAGDVLADTQYAALRVKLNRSVPVPMEDDDAFETDEVIIGGAPKHVRRGDAFEVAVSVENDLGFGEHGDRYVMVVM